VRSSQATPAAVDMSAPSTSTNRFATARFRLIADDYATLNTSLARTPASVRDQTETASAIRLKQPSAIAEIRTRR
jgi:hypothetical protein